MFFISTCWVILSITGIACLFSRRLSLPKVDDLFSAVALCGCLMTVAFIGNFPQTMADILFMSGSLSIAYHLTCAYFRYSGRKLFIACRWPVLTGFALIAVLWLLAWQQRFGSIDDYSFWGTISRYLYIFHHLPENSNYIKASFLTYTPGVACFHYLFYFAYQNYIIELNYIAQNILLLTPLLLLFDKNKPNLSLNLIFTTLITLFFAYGNVLAKLQVDALVAIWFFALLWRSVQRPDPSWLVMISGLMFLSMIKEIGLLFAFVIVLTHVLHQKSYAGKFKHFIVLALALLLMKYLWHLHVHQYGFQSFAHRMTIHKNIVSLIPGNENYIRSQYLFLRGVLFGNFDNIVKMPFWLVYLFCLLQIYWHWRHFSQYKSLLMVFAGFIPIYLILLYWLQAVVFRVGYEQAHLLDFPRYFNMALVPFILFILAVSMSGWGMGMCVRRQKHWMTGLVVMCLILVIGGKLERTRKFYHPYDYTNLLARITAEGSTHKGLLGPLCLNNVPKPEYQFLMPLQFKLLPVQVINLDTHKSRNCHNTFDLATMRLQKHVAD